MAREGSPLHGAVTQGRRVKEMVKGRGQTPAPQSPGFPRQCRAAMLREGPLEMTDGGMLALVSVPIRCVFRRVAFSPGPEAQVYCSPCAERFLGGCKSHGRLGNASLASGWRVGLQGTILLRRAASLLRTSKSLTCKEIWEVIIQNSVPST